MDMSATVLIVHLFMYINYHIRVYRKTRARSTIFLLYYAYYIYTLHTYINHRRQ